MKKRKQSAIKLLLISLAIMAVCSLIALAMESNLGKTKIQTVEWVASDGTALAGTLYVPQNATIDTPAPGIVLCHGMYCERTLLDAYYTELSRRGYVVLAYDQPSHGLSETVRSVATITTSGYEAVTFMRTLPYVDLDSIGISGHSHGGSSTNNACAAGNMKELYST